MQIENHWIKRGVIFNPVDLNEWIKSHAYIPTPILLNDETIRIFVAFRDAAGVGRVGYVDVQAKDPFEVISVSQTPCLDVGKPGTFDDNGVTPISVVNENGNLYLYYAGWQLSDKVRYFLFAGMAVSSDMGNSFKRVKNVPILERTDQEFLVRTAPGVFKQDKKWHMIYSGGNKTVQLENNKTVPSYSLKYLTSNDGINWGMTPQEVLIPEVTTEYGFGRPFVMYENEVYKMWYSIRRFNKKYTLGYAESTDLRKWVRLDNQLGSFTQDTNSYENEMQGFAAIIKTKYGNYMLYNGNNFGETGICCAFQKSN
jgi:predicted GH43/DUF377 family glycosyl hydrolase